MALAFPGILFYGIALFAIADFLKEERQRNTYRYLTAFSLTPWLCLHLFYIMICTGLPGCPETGMPPLPSPYREALFAHLSWLVIVSEADASALSRLVFGYWPGKERFPKGHGFVQSVDLLSSAEADHPC